MEVRFKLTKYRVAIAALFVLAGVGLGNLLSPLVGTALATVGTVSNISDHSAAAYFAKVDSSGALKTTAAVTGRVGMAAPPSPWRASVSIQTFGFPGAVLAGPSTAPINITSISVSGGGSVEQSVDVNGYLVPTSATTCSGASFDTRLWEGKALDGAPVAASFPTPLQYKPPANKKACVFGFETSTAAETALNVSGFYG
jgi:hypothetical protein